MKSDDPSAKIIVRIANKAANEIGKGFEKAKFQEAEGALFEVENSLTKLLGINDKGLLNVGSADIPGFGVGVGGFPEILLTPAGRTLRQQVQALANITLKDRSGAAVTTQEFERFKTEFGIGALKTEAQLLEGLRLARAGIEQHRRNLYKGHNPDNVRVYESRSGSTSLIQNIFPETKFGDRGESAPAPKLGTPLKFDSSKTLPDNPSQAMIDARIKFLNDQGFQ